MKSVLRFTALSLIILLAVPVACTPNASSGIQPRDTPTSQPALGPGGQSAATPSPEQILTPSWFQNVVLYEIFPRSFYDSNGDGIGDLRGIVDQLGYLQELGIGAIWLTPIFASPSYHGYDISDYMQVNPDLGTEDDFIDLVQEAHRHHIRVLLDFVAAHTSSQHPFFKDAFAHPESKYSGWYQWYDPQHTVYASFATVPEMPTLNYDEPEVQDYMLSVAQHWMRTGIDGYRCDYALGVPHAFWKRLRKELKAINPDFLLLAEAWTSARGIQPYYDGEFDAAFDFPLYGDIEGSQDKIGDSFLLGRLSPHLADGTLAAEKILYPSGAQRVVFLNNHDTNRVMSEVNGDVRRAKLAATLLLTLPGTPMLYYGEEIGMTGVKGAEPDYDKLRREPMDWYASESGPGMTWWFKPTDRNNKSLDGVSVEEELHKPDSLLEHYRKLIALRQAYPALRSASWVVGAVDGNPSIYAFVRREGEDAFLVLLNFSDAAASVSLDLGGTSLPDQPYSATDILSGRSMSLPGSTFRIQVDPLSSMVLRLVHR